MSPSLNLFIFIHNCGSRAVDFLPFIGLGWVTLSDQGALESKSRISDWYRRLCELDLYKSSLSAKAVLNYLIYYLLEVFSEDETGIRKIQYGILVVNKQNSSPLKCVGSKWQLFPLILVVSHWDLIQSMDSFIFLTWKPSFSSGDQRTKGLLT